MNALPWLEAPLRRALASVAGHALLIHGPRGVGQFELGVDIASAWLCESGGSTRPCGACASCRLVAARTHPDLLVLLPEAQREALGWASLDDETPAREGKTKPSKDIRVEEVRQAIGFTQSTSARGRGKLLVIHPAERMNAVAANALLKTLEEPPGSTRLVLCSAAPDRLLPTIRSRCQALALALPEPALAARWLAEQGIADPEAMLRASGGLPQDVLEAAALGIDATLWARLPAIVARGETAPLAGWPLPRLIDALQKLCHDAWCMSRGAAPRFFAPGSLGAAASPDALQDWSAALRTAARHDEHPWNAALLAESLVEQGRRALGRTPSRRDGPLHSAR